MAQPPEEDSFLSRWSRRKRASEDVPLPEAAPDEAVSAEETDSISDEDLAALPSIEELTPKTDIRPFLRKGVPKTLRNAALRKMWMLTPSIRDHADPAVDYAWDWNTPGGVPGDGAGPTVERAAEMLRDLVSSRRNAEDENALETDALTQAEPAPEPVVAAVQKRPETAGETAFSQAPDADPPPKATVTEDKENQSTNETDVPRRRHGTALPS